MPEIKYRGRRAVRIENDRIALTVSIEGGHIAELIDKKTGVNPLWVPPWPSIEPSTYDRERHPEYGDNSESQLLAGILGHNIALDIFGGPSEEESRAGIPVHGEVNIVAHEIAAQEAEMRAIARLPLTQLEFERTMQLEDNSVRIVETVTNLLPLDRPIAWTQHVTLGAPFIEPGVTTLAMPVRRSKTYPTNLSEHQKYAVFAEFDWPHAPNKDGSATDLSVMPPYERSGGVTGHLVEEGRDEGWFVAANPKLNVAIGYQWKRADFPWVSLWEENRSRAHAPWNGVTITRGVEFGASPFAESRRSMVERSTMFGTPVYRWLPARGRLSVEYRAWVGRADSAMDRP